MQYDILLTKQPTNGYLARPVLMPEIVVSGEDEKDALARVRIAIAKATEHSHIVRVDVPNSGESTGDPWLRFGGMWGSEAEWEQFNEDINILRCEIDEQTEPSREIDA